MRLIQALYIGRLIYYYAFVASDIAMSGIDGALSMYSAVLNSIGWWVGEKQ